MSTGSRRPPVQTSPRAVESTGRTLELDASWRTLAEGERPSREVKAATYHGLKVTRAAGFFSATVILDV